MVTRNIVILGYGCVKRNVSSSAPHRHKSHAMGLHLYNRVAFQAFTAVRLDKIVEVLFAVVIGELLTGSDVPLRVDIYFSAHNVGFAIRSAGMVHIAGTVLPRRAVYNLLLAHLKEVPTALFVRRLTGEYDTVVLNNKIAALYVAFGVQSEPGGRPSHVQYVLTRSGCVFGVLC